MTTLDRPAVGPSYQALLEQAAAAAAEPQWARERRRAAFGSFLAQGFPTTRMEDWRYTSVAPIADTTFAAPQAREASAAQLAPHLFEELGGPLLVFLDGRYQPQLSRVGALPRGFTLKPLSEALAAPEPTLEKHLGTIGTNDGAPFTALARALATDGVFLHAAAGAVLEQPIQLVFLTQGGAEPELHAQRSLMVFEAGSQVTIIETHAALSGATTFTAGVLEVVVDENAHVDHYTLQRHNRESFEITGHYLRQDRSSTYRHHQLDLGGALVRHNSWAWLVGEGCEATLNGLYVLANRQHLDNWMRVEHVAENIPSHEVYKGVLMDESSASFCGRIYVHKEAQKTDAKQTNQNLLLSDSAKVNTKPQLEIYADDVKCTHGATIGQLDDSALFYLMSRGIDKHLARNLLVHAFASDIVERVRVEPLRLRVEELLTALLPAD